MRPHDPQAPREPAAVVEASIRPAGSCGALSGRAVDLIRDGVHPDDLKARGSFAVDATLQATAKFAVHCGMSRPEWEVIVMDPGSRLGEQARIRIDGKGRRKRATARELANRLGAAWERAWEQIGGTRPWSDSEVRAEALRRAAAALATADDPDYVTAAGLRLLDSDRRVLRYLGEAARRRGLPRVAESRRAIVKEVELGRTAVDNALDRLTRAGLIRKYRRGQPGADSRIADLWEILPNHRAAPTPAPPIEAGLRPAYGAPSADERTYGAPREEGPVPVGPPATMVPPPRMAEYVAAASPEQLSELRAMLEAAEAAARASEFRL